MHKTLKFQLTTAYFVDPSSSLATALRWAQLSHPAILHLLPDSQPAAAERTPILCSEDAKYEL